MRDKWNYTFWNMNLNFRHAIIFLFPSPFWLGLCCTTAFLCTLENFTQHSKIQLILSEETSWQLQSKEVLRISLIATIGLLHFITIILYDTALVDPSRGGCILLFFISALASANISIPCLLSEEIINKWSNAWMNELGEWKGNEPEERTFREEKFGHTKGSNTMGTLVLKQ